MPFMGMANLLASRERENSQTLAQAGISQKLSILFGKPGIDADPRADLEPGLGGESWTDPQIPVQLRLTRSVACGCHDVVVIVWIAQPIAQSCQNLTKRQGEVTLLLVSDRAEIRLMILGHDPCFERHFRGIGNEYQEGMILQDDPLMRFALKSQNIAVDTPAPVIKVALRHFFPPPDVPRHDAGDDQLGMRVSEGGPGASPMIAEDNDHHVFMFPHQGDVPSMIGFDDGFDGMGGHQADLFVVSGAFNDNLVTTKSLHPRVDPSVEPLRAALGP